MLICVLAKNSDRIEMQKLTDHPIRVGSDPNYDCKVMANLTHILSRSYSNYNSNYKGWKDHGYSQWTPDHTPADIFQKPKNNVQVFHFTIS